MDSGNSGSIQSSSGGDEEYDSSSRATTTTDSISPFATHPPPHHHHHNSTTLFDPLPNYFDPTPLPNFDPIWSKTSLLTTTTASPNCTYNSLSLPSSGTALSSSPTVHFDPPKTDPVQPQPQQLARNPKKRSRASRRAPTTVLTTDTNNFRAMVQEFTGIPAPPFTSSSSPFLRNRLDLFGTPAAASTRSYPLSDGLLQPPPYLLRPFAQKFQTPPPFLSPNGNDVVPGNSTGSNSNSNSNSNANAAVNYQMQNQILTFQSLLQSPSVLRSSGQDFLGMPSGNINDDVNPTVWGGGGGVLGLNGGDQGNNHIMRPVNGSYGVDYSHSGGGKGNYEKGSETVGGGAGAGRAGGMVESWICSSDH